MAKKDDEEVPAVAVQDHGAAGAAAGVVSSERGGQLDETAGVAAALAKFKEANGRPARRNGHEEGTDVVFDVRRRRFFFLDGNGDPVWMDCPPRHTCNEAGELVKES